MSRDKNVDDLFLVVVTFNRTLKVQTSKKRDKNLAADLRGPLAAGASSHGTTGTMDNAALGGSGKFSSFSLCIEDDD